ncbi:MAG: acetyl esterase [Cyclobacteriaceae bacterium]|jgi:acetyl esterase
MRFIRENAARFNIDPDQIIGAGGSDGGHLAAATALTAGYNEVSDDIEISSKPNCLILFNPVIDNGPGSYGYKHFGEDYKNFSPLHNIQKGAPPTLILIGSEDELVPVETVKYYRKVMEKVGARCDLNSHKGQKHAFFNYENFKYYKKTVLEADFFCNHWAI